MEESRRITSKANLWADLGSRGQMAAAVQQAVPCRLRGAREVVACPEWRDTSALCAAARGRDRPAPHPSRYVSAVAAYMQRVHDPHLAKEKPRSRLAEVAGEVWLRRSGMRKSGIGVGLVSVSVV